MRFRVHPDAAWVVEEDKVSVMALPDGELLVLEDTGATIFRDVVDGLDPVATGVKRWGKEAEEGVNQFLEQLSDHRLVIDAQPRQEHSFDLADPEPEEEGTKSGDYSIVFLCTANICRSAYADLAARHANVPGLKFSSAGTHAQVGDHMDPPMADELRRRGISTRGHRAQRLSTKMVRDADLILVMSSAHREFVLEEWPGATRRTFLMGHAARVARQLDDGVGLGEFAERLWTTRTSGLGEAVHDPYGQGRQAAQDCAAQIDEFLADILDFARRQQPAAQ